MATTFWNGWQLWEKMCFILGCAIVLVIFGGCIKLIYNHHRIRKYTKLAADKAAIRQQMQRTASVRHKEIPFGVRALESGMEVDGVWISGSNTPLTITPVQSTPGSPTPSTTTENPKTVLVENVVAQGGSSSITRTPIETSQLAHGYVASRLSVPTKPTYQPRRSSGLRFSDVNDAGDRVAALAALEGLPASAEPMGNENHSGPEGPSESHRRSQSWATTAWTESRDPATEFNQPVASRFQSHPLRRVSNRLGGFPNGNQERKDDVLEGVGDGSAVYVPTRGRAPMSYEDLSYQEALHAEALGYDNDSSSSEASDHFFTQSTLKASYTGHDPGPTCYELDGNTSRYSGLPAEPIGVTMADAPEHGLQPRRSREALQDVRKSQVIRKINSGFEILRPGSLGRPQHSSTVGQAKSASEKDKQRQPKKLQRRRRDSTQNRG